MRELTDLDRKLISNIEEYGFHSLRVFDPEGNDPDFCYSVGFQQTLGKPEFIITGLNNKLMHNMLWETFRQLKAGLTVRPMMKIDGLLEGFTCFALPVKEENLVSSWFGHALWHLNYLGKSDSALEAYQIIWPGASNGLYPWQDEEVASLQPLLCDPKASAN